MKIIIALFCCSFLSSLAWFVSAPSAQTQGLKPQTSAKRDASALWELAIEAKGGRSRLYEVRNILESYVDKTNVGLYVFPSKHWRWTDDRPTPLGVYVVMDNPQGKLSYEIEEDTPSPPPNLGERHAREALWDNYHAQLYYLLETQWLKPLPVKVYSGTIGNRAVDIVQTIVHFPQAPRANDNGHRYDFYLDKQSHLPLKVVFPWPQNSEVTNYGLGTYYVTFSDYADVNGIQMPRKVGHLAKPELPLRIQLNVEYDPAIFEHPPSIKAGPDVWKQQSSAVGTTTTTTISTSTRGG
jgi:hypothetical protein